MGLLVTAQFETKQSVQDERPLDINAFEDLVNDGRCDGVRVMLPRELIKQPAVLPVGHDRVQGLKHTILAALREDGQAGKPQYNGLLDPVWIIRLPDGSYEIANGFHRYEATNQLLEEGLIDRTELYALVVDGTYDDLWQSRLIGAGEHTSLAPARFIVFLKENFEKTVIGMNMEFDMLVSYLKTPENQLSEIADLHAVDVELLRNTLGIVRTAIHMMQIDIDDAISYAQISSGLNPELLNRLRMDAKRDRGELPITLAREILLCPKLCLVKNQPYQLTLFTEGNRHGFSINQIKTLLRKAEAVLTKGGEPDVDILISEILGKTAQIIDNRAKNGHTKPKAEITPTAPALKRNLLRALHERGQVRLQNILLEGENHARKLTDGHTSNPYDVIEFYKLIDLGVFRSIPDVCTVHRLKLTPQLMNVIVEASFKRIFPKVTHGAEEIEGFSLTVIEETVAEVAKVLAKNPDYQFLTIFPELSGINPQIVDFMTTLLEGIEADMLKDARPTVHRLKAQIVLLERALAARDREIDELLSEMTDEDDLDAEDIDDVD